MSEDPHGVVTTDPQGVAAHTGTFGRLVVTVRNDGSAPVDILAAAVHDTGVRPLLSGPGVVVQPGQPVLVTVPVEVDCTNLGLPRHLSALTLTVRNPDGHIGQVVLAGPPPASPDAATSAGDYYSLCGKWQTSTTPAVAYDRLVTAATAADRTFSYRVTVAGSTGFAQILDAAAPGTTGSTGSRITTDLATAVPLTAGLVVPVIITVHADDCTRIGATLGGGATGPNTTATAAGINALLTATALDVTPADRRFPQLPVTLTGPASPKYYADILTQFLVACPNLE